MSLARKAGPSTKRKPLWKLPRRLVSMVFLLLAFSAAGSAALGLSRHWKVSRSLTVWWKRVMHSDGESPLDGRRGLSTPLLLADPSRGLGTVDGAVVGTGLGANASLGVAPSAQAPGAGTIELADAFPSVNIVADRSSDAEARGARVADGSSSSPALEDSDGGEMKEADDGGSSPAEGQQVDIAGGLEEDALGSNSSAVQVPAGIVISGNQTSGVEDDMGEQDLVVGTDDTTGAESIGSPNAALAPDSSFAASLAVLAGGHQAPPPPTATPSWKTPYIREHVVRVEGVAACRRFASWRGPAGQARGRPIRRMVDLERPGQRVLVFVPRFGLGNSLRGFVSSFVLAALTGRRLVRFHGADHYMVFDSLCQSFHCGFDAIRWSHHKKPQDLWSALFRLKPKPDVVHTRLRRSGVRSLVLSNNPVMVARMASHYDAFWVGNHSIVRCVNAAFSCKSLWCVRSRAMNALLGGGPTQKLGEVIDSMLQVAGRSGSFPPGSAEPPPSQGGPLGIHARFDLAVHFRTRPEHLEKEGGNQAHLDGDRYLAKQVWVCIDHVIRRRLPKLSPRWRNSSEELRIFLATDNEVLRPAFVERLRRYGSVYFSTGKVVHTSKSKGHSGRLPTFAEFYLLAKSDVILEAENYVSTFAHFASLVGNGTLLAMHKLRETSCSIRIDHRGNPKRQR